MSLYKRAYYAYLADNIKEFPLQLFKVTFSAKLNDPLRDPSL